MEHTSKFYLFNCFLQLVSSYQKNDSALSIDRRLFGVITRLKWMRYKKRAHVYLHTCIRWYIHHRRESAIILRIRIVHANRGRGTCKLILPFRSIFLACQFIPWKDFPSPIDTMALVLRATKWIRHKRGQKEFPNAPAYGDMCTIGALKLIEPTTTNAKKYWKYRFLKASATISRSVFLLPDLCDTPGDEDASSSAGRNSRNHDARMITAPHPTLRNNMAFLQSREPPRARKHEASTTEVRT